MLTKHGLADSNPSREEGSGINVHQNRFTGPAGLTELLHLFETHASLLAPATAPACTTGTIPASAPWRAMPTPLQRMGAYAS